MAAANLVMNWQYAMTFISYKSREIVAPQETGMQMNRHGTSNAVEHA